MAKSKSEVVAGIAKDLGEDWDDAKTAPAKPRGFQDLPPGIRGGIAQVLTDPDEAAKFDTNDSNQRRLRIVCVACSPPEAAGIQFMQFYTFADRKTRTGRLITKQDTLKGLSTDLQLMGSSLPSTPADMAELGDSIAGAYFLFNTSTPKQKGQSPFVNIQGVPDEEDLVEAGLEEAAAEQPQSKPKSGGRKTKPTTKQKEELDPVDEADPPEPAAENNGEVILDTGDIWYYKPPRKRKPVRVEISEVNEDLCDLVELDEDDVETGKTYEDVNATSLIDPDSL